MIIRNKCIPFGRFDYMSIYPFIFIKSDINKTSMNHELIHAQQQKEISILFACIFTIISIIFGFSLWYLFICATSFYMLYVINWIFEIIAIMWSDKKAYSDIVFEKEARANQDNANYLSERPLFAWIKYF